jgi:hypothetical protein
VGVHTPEFAFEVEIWNITRAAAQLGVRYPIAVDNDYGTCNSYQNNYWPAEHLMDAAGTVRDVDNGEGQYTQTETSFRQLLVRRNRRWCYPFAPTTRPNAPGADHPRDVPRLPLQRGQPVRRERHRRHDDQLSADIDPSPRCLRLRRSVACVDRGGHSRPRSNPGVAVPGTRRLAGAGWPRHWHCTGIRRRGADPHGGRGWRTEAVPTGRPRGVPAGHADPIRAEWCRCVRLHFRLIDRAHE